MPSFILKDIDPKLWDRVKRRATAEGRTRRFVLMELITEYANHGYDVMITELRNPPGSTAVKKP